MLKCAKVQYHLVNNKDTHESCTKYLVDHQMISDTLYSANSFQHLQQTTY